MLRSGRLAAGRERKRLKVAPGPLGRNQLERGKKSGVKLLPRSISAAVQNGSARVEPRRREPRESGQKVQAAIKTFSLKSGLTILLIHNLENYIPIFTEENEISHLTKTTNKILFELKLNFSVIICIIIL